MLMSIYFRMVCIALVSALVLANTALANDNPGAFVTQSTGDVHFLTEQTELQPLPPFAKIFSGTQVNIGDDGKFQIVYLQNGLQESWTGPAKLEINEGASKSLSTSSPPQIKKLPPYMVDVLTRSREVISDIQSRQGMIRVRSLTTARKVKKAEENYASMRQQAADDDITPEIYLLTTFDELKVYKRMKAPLQEIMQRQPNNKEAKQLHDQFMAILEAEQKALK